MAIRVVRLGSPRVEGEGTRIGTVRRPPRGVPKTEFASQNWYDVRYPNLSPSVETIKKGDDLKYLNKFRCETMLSSLLEMGSDKSNYLKQ